MIHDYLQLKINESYKALKLATEMSLLYYQKPLILTYSGGKDSDVMLQLAIECLKPTDFEVLNSHTTVDAPETVYYIREKFKELEKYPKYKQNYINAFQRMVNKRKACGKPDKENWKDGESVYKWWVGDDSIPGQMDIYSFLDKENKDEN